MTNHFGLDLDLVELLAGVDTDDAADHLRDNDHVTEVSPDGIRLLVGLGLLLSLAQLLDETHRLALQAAVESTTGTSMDEVAEFFGGEVEEPGDDPSAHPFIFISPDFSNGPDAGEHTGRVQHHGS